MYRTRTLLKIGMPHSYCRALNEVALLAHVGNLRWNDFGVLTERPASRQRDSEGREVYASFFFIDLDGFPDLGLAAFGPDDELEIVSRMGRYGRTMLDGDYSLFRAGELPADLPENLPAAPRVRLSNVFVGLGSGADDLSITTPSNARIENVPSLPEEPDSYRIIKRARQAGFFFDAPPQATALWSESDALQVAIDPDRDLNGVGLLYFSNYVAFMNRAERVALETRAGFTPESLDGRVTLRRRVGFYGNARPHDTLEIDVEAFRLAAADTLLLHHRIRRRGDGRLIAVGSVEKRLRPAVG